LLRQQRFHFFNFGIKRFKCFGFTQRFGGLVIHFKVDKSHRQGELRLNILGHLVGRPPEVHRGFSPHFTVNVTSPPLQQIETAFEAGVNLG
jgi:hypothetical protein